MPHCAALHTHTATAYAALEPCYYAMAIPESLWYRCIALLRPWCPFLELFGGRDRPLPRRCGRGDRWPVATPFTPMLSGIAGILRALIGRPWLVVEPRTRPVVDPEPVRRPPALRCFFDLVLGALRLVAMPYLCDKQKPSCAHRWPQPQGGVTRTLSWCRPTT